MPHSSSWLEIGDYTLHWGGVCGAPTLVLADALEAALSIPLAPPSDLRITAVDAISIGVHLHAFYLESCPEIFNILRQTLPKCQLLVTTDCEHKRACLEALLTKYTESSESPLGWTYSIIVTPNQGRNVLPLLRDAWPALRSCDLVLHLHTKQSPQSSSGQMWARELVSALVGTVAQVESVVTAFVADAELGMVIPRNWAGIRNLLSWGANFEIACLISQSQGMRAEILTVKRPSHRRPIDAY